jgi:hypothetical protein
MTCSEHAAARVDDCAPERVMGSAHSAEVNPPALSAVSFIAAQVPFRIDRAWLRASESGHEETSVSKQLDIQAEARPLHTGAVLVSSKMYLSSTNGHGNILDR